jgi:hypothetical protein
MFCCSVEKSRLTGRYAFGASASWLTGWLVRVGGKKRDDVEERVESFKEDVP